MTWQLFDIAIIGNQSQVLLDDQYISDNPGASLPDIAWFAVWCLQDTAGHYWNPEETDKLEKIESDLLNLVGEHGNGWAVYVRRVASAGMREYFIYYGEGAALAEVVPALKALHPEYRIESETKPDPEWKHYFTWLKEVPQG